MYTPPETLNPGQLAEVQVSVAIVKFVLHSETSAGTSDVARICGFI